MQGQTKVYCTWIPPSEETTPQCECGRFFIKLDLLFQRNSFYSESTVCPSALFYQVMMVLVGDGFGKYLLGKIKK